MLSGWELLREQHERQRWARLNAGFERPTDAARSLGIPPGTYRTYEQRLGDGGRTPPLSAAQGMARKFKIRWEWLVAGRGSPELTGGDDTRLAELGDKIGRIPPDKRDDAIDAAVSVLESYLRRARK